MVSGWDIYFQQVSANNHKNANAFLLEPNNVRSLKWDINKVLPSKNTPRGAKHRGAPKRMSYRQTSGMAKLKWSCLHCYERKAKDKVCASIDWKSCNHTFWAHLATKSETARLPPGLSKGSFTTPAIKPNYSSGYLSKVQTSQALCT